MDKKLFVWTLENWYNLNVEFEFIPQLWEGLL